MEWIIKFCLKSLIVSYRMFLSPLLLGLGGQCRFYPSCSAYALEAIKRLPLPGALAKIARRLMSCHPFHPGGIDWVTKEGANS